MNRIVVFMLAVAGLLTAAGQSKWRAGEGIANDHATGANARDVTFVARDADNGYGYRQYAVPVGLTFLPWSLPNFESHVYGVRINLGWGRYADTYGLDCGTFSDSVAFGGIAANLFGNRSTGTTAGIQTGLVNIGQGNVYGVQIGAVNFAGQLRGLQIGFLNFNSAGIVLPLINAGW